MKKMLTTFAASAGLLFFLALATGCKRDSTKANDLSPASTANNPKLEAMKQAAAEKLRVSNLGDVSYAQIQNLRQNIQVFIFQNVDNTSKARLWQEKISSIIAITTDPARRSSLEELRQLFTPALYDHGPGSQGSAPYLHDWADHNKAIFSEEEINVVLLTLNRVGVDAATKRYNEVPGETNLFENPPCPPYCGSGPYCYCNQAHYSAHCANCRNVQCTWQWGCGYGGNEYCDGQCSGYGSGSL